MSKQRHPIVAANRLDELCLCLCFGLSMALGIAALVSGCQVGGGGFIAPGADQSLLKGVGVDGRGAENVTGAVGVDASDTESNEATQGATTITGKGATVYNIQAVGGSAMLLMITVLGAGLYLARKKGGAASVSLDNTTEALDRVMHILRKDESASGVRKAIHDAGCSTHPTKGHIHDDAEAVIRSRLNLIRVNDQ